jgi:hypothetical protein
MAMMPSAPHCAGSVLMKSPPAVCIFLPANSTHPIIRYNIAMRSFFPALLLTLSLPLAISAAPVRTEVTHDHDQWQLLRDGKPYLIKGGGGNSSLEALVTAGGNSMRTWSTDHLDKQLDAAQKLGLTVTVGFWLGHARHGFDYSNAQQVEDQLDRAREAILKYKDHPAVLIWAIGNEMETGIEDNAAMWSAVNNLAAMAHKLDPNHPTMTVVAEIGGKKVRHLHKLCPEVDIIGINSYGGITTVAKRYKEAGGTKPYVITEFGPAGIWESKKNAFGVAPELTSTEKAERYAEAWRSAVVSQPGQCFGGYAFTWGFKQEATATWFGTFLPDGAHLGALDALTEAWTGKPPANKCPEIRSLKVDGADDVDPGAAVHVSLDAADPEKDPLKIKWILQAETAAFALGGDAEITPATYADAITQSDLTSATVTMPKDGGSYRLFAYVYDDHGGAAVANVPLHVKGAITLPKAKVAALPLIVSDEADRDNPSYIPAGWMGNAKAILLDPKCATQPHSGKTCLRCDFTDTQGWGGVVWQSPAGDWGDLAGGFNLTGAKKLTFWARGQKGGETITFLFGLFPREKRFFDTASGKLDKVALTTEWKQYEIDLAGKDLSRIKSGFAWSLASSGEPITFYLDDVQYE